MNRIISGMLLHAMVFSFITANAWAAPNWWKGVNEPVQPIDDAAPRTEAPNVIEKARYKVSHPSYVALKLGAYFPQFSDLNIYDTGFNGEIALGHYFTPNVALEFSAGYLETSSDRGSADVTSYPILLSIKGAIPVPGGEFYVLAGGGIYITNIESGSNINSDDTPFGFQLGVGGNFNLSEYVFLGLEGKYFFAKPSFDLPGGTSYEPHIDGLQATANIGYRF
ncbi:porin family protein [bacterium]|nr:porin family protein [bacterium]